MMQREQRSVLWLPLLIAVLIAVPSLAKAAEIVIKPGKFDHFNITMPERVVAGEETTIRLLAVDAFNNVIANFNESGREFQLAASGSAVVKPTTLKASAFTNGALAISLVDKVAEAVTLSIRETGSPIPIVSKELMVFPNKMTSFAIREPRRAQAGDPFDIRIVAKDAYGNTVFEPIPGKNINLIFKGDADPKIDMPAIPDFKSGVSVVTLVSQKAGITQIEVKDLITGSSGMSEKIEITSGPVNAFKIFAPKEVIAGEPFELSIVAVDRFNNVVTNYATTGSGVTITATGKLRPFPSTISAYEFVNGQAKADLRYDVAEDIALVVTESGKAQKGATDTIRVVSPVPERYEVTVPESAVAGQKFKIKITVYNQLGHVIKNYNLVGPDVALSTTGTGTLVPNKIPASEFINGTTVVEVQYNKSEAFSIIAAPAKTSTPSATAAAQPEVRRPAPAAADRHQAKAAAVSPAASQAKKEKRTKEGARDAKKTERKVKAKARGLEITNISLVESKKKSTVTMHIPNLDNSLRYSAATETAEGKRWVVLRAHPAASRVEKNFKFNSAFIGDISIDGDAKEKGTTVVRIEMLKPAKYHVTKEKNALAVTLRLE
ncbi:MAG: hypothetical protein AB1805_12775 [Nitrospirota bacterium]